MKISSLSRADNMSTLELALNMLAEAATTELTKVENPQGLNENRKVARSAGAIAGNARKEIEETTGQPVITKQNETQLNEVITGLIGAVTEDDDYE